MFRDLARKRLHDHAGRGGEAVPQLATRPLEGRRVAITGRRERHRPRIVRVFSAAGARVAALDINEMRWRRWRRKPAATFYAAT